jgi:hypothetical protein
MSSKWLCKGLTEARGIADPSLGSSDCEGNGGVELMEGHRREILVMPLV